MPKATQPSGANRVVRDFDAATSVEDVDRDKRIVVHKISTDAVDRYKTVLFPEGMRSVNYRNNPVVLSNHDMDRVIGRNLDIKVYKRKVIARTKFLPKGTDENADKVFDLYELGYLNGWSVSFDPIEAGPPSPDEVRKRPDLAECRCVYRAWDLLEYSCVTVPGNQECYRQAQSRGLWLPEWPTATPATETPPAAPPTPADPAAGLPPLIGRSIEDVAAAIRRRVAEQTGDHTAVMRDVLELARGMV